MVDSLVRLHLREKFGLDAEVLPPDFPLQVFRLVLTGRSIDRLLVFLITGNNLQLLFRLALVFLLFINRPVIQLLNAKSPEDLVFAS